MSARQEPFLNPAAPGAAPGAADLSAGGYGQDALLQALVWLGKHHGRERSAQSLLTGIQMSGALGPDQAVRVMREAGFNAGLIQRKIGDIHALLLPAVLLLKNGDACIVVARKPPAKKGAASDYDVVMPGPESHSCNATEAELSVEYTGFALVASPKPQAQNGPVHASLRDPEAHWLWGTLRRFTPYYRSAMLAALLSNVLMLVSGLVTSVVFDK